MLRPASAPLPILMKKVLIALLFLACVLLPIGILATLSVPLESSADRPGAGGLAPGAPGTPGSGGLLVADDLQRADLGPTGAPRQEEVIEIHGRVQVPQGCEESGTLQVFCLRDSISTRDFREHLALELPADRDPLIYDRAIADDDGRFTLAFPETLPRVHLILHGRYQYVERSRAIPVHGLDLDVTLEPRCGAHLIGVLIAPEDRADDDLSGATCDLEPDSRDLMADTRAGTAMQQRTETDAGGRFEFVGIDPELSATVSVEPGTLASARVDVGALERGRTHTIEIPLVVGGSLSGRVLDTEGRPVANASILAKRRGELFGVNARRVREVRSDADGRFRLEGVEPGELVVRASAPGYLESDGSSLVLRDRESRADLALELSRGNRIGGIVRWSDGRAAADVEVQVGFDLSAMTGLGAFNAQRGASGSARTDTDGRFEVTGLGLGPFTVQALAAPDGSQSAQEEARDASDLGALADAFDDRELDARERESWRARLDGVRPGSMELVLSLEEPVSLPGRVTDTAGDPLEHFTLHARRFTDGLLGSVGQDVLREDFHDEDGRFQLVGLQHGNWRVSALADGFAVSEPVEVTLPSDRGVPSLEFRLLRAATVVGTVKNPLGLAAQGALVQLDPGAGMRRITQQLTRPPRRIESVSSFDGSFRLEGLTYGRHVLVATSPDFAGSEPVEVLVAPGEVLSGVELLMREGGVLTGSVFREGKPAAGMFVQVTNLSNYSSRMTDSDEAGEFRLEHLDPGSYQVVALSTSTDLSDLADPESSEAAMSSVMSGVLMESAEIVNGRVTEVVLGAPPTDPIDVTGVVTRGGAPLRGANIAFLTEGTNFLGSLQLDSLSSSGEFSVTLERPGPYLIAIQKHATEFAQQSSIELFVEIPDVREYRLELEAPNGSIAGTVLTPAGDPAPRTRVTVAAEGGRTAGSLLGPAYFEGMTDADGAFRVAGLEAGTYRVTAGGAPIGGVLGDRATHGRASVTGLVLGPDETREGVKLTLSQPASLAVRVVDPEGRPVVEAGIFLRGEDGTLVDAMTWKITDALGEATYDGLAPGRYSVTARGRDLASPPSSFVTVAPDERTEVELELEPASTLIVSVEDDDGAKLRASYRILDEDGNEVQRMWSVVELQRMMSGSQYSLLEPRFGPLAPGKYKVFATLPDGTVLKKPVSLRGQPERALTLRARD